MYVSWFMLFLLVLITGIIAYAISNYLGKKNGEEWKVKCIDAEKNYSELHKENKKDKKQLTNLGRQVDTWKTKFEESEAKFIPLTEKLSANNTELQTTLDTQNADHIKLDNAFKQLENKNERMANELQHLKDKYATDLSDSKGWKNLRDRLNRTIEELNAKLEKVEKDKARLNTRLEGQIEEIRDVKKMSGEFRVLKVTNKKLTKDLEYWEQKHFDTHHELATTLTKIEELKAANKEIDLLHKGALIKEQNLLEKIIEFKTKFVDVNNKYHELVKK